MNAVRFIDPKDVALPPNPRRRLCPHCYEIELKKARWQNRPFVKSAAMSELDDDWICPGCGERVVCHFTPEPCPDCGREAWVRYSGNRRRQWCDCGLSQEDRDAIAVAEVEAERQKALASRRAAEQELAAVRARKELEVVQRKADRCWDSKGNKCSVKAKKPLYSFCAECIHLKPRDYRPPPSHLEGGQ